MRAKWPTKRRMDVESLETRVLLSTVLSLQGKDLVVQGDNGPNSVIITDNGGGVVLVRTENQSKWSSFSGVSRVLARTGRGNDSVLYRFSSNVSSPRTVDIDTGSGNDRVEFSTSRSGLVFGAPVSLRAVCGTGNDVCVSSLRDVVLGGAAKSAVDMFLKLEMVCGGGDDDCDDKITLGAGSTGGVSVSVDGGTGDDQVSVESSPSSSTPNAAAVDYFLKIDIRGNSGIDDIDVDLVCPDETTASSVRLDGGTGDDSISSRVSVSPPASSAPVSSTDAFIKMHLLGGDGADQITSELSIDPRCDGAVQSSVSGGAGDDTIFIKMPPSSSAVAGASVRYFMKVEVACDQGNDQLDADLTLCPGGAASHSVSLDGGTGSDAVACRVLGSSSLATAPDGSAVQATADMFLKLSLRGGAGNDDVSAEMTIEAGQLGGLDCDVDGGTGDDELTFSRTDVVASDSSGGGSGGSARSFDAFLKLECVGGQGSDRISTNLTIGPGSADTNCVALDGGADDDALFLKLSSLASNGLPAGTPFSFIKIDMVGGLGEDEVSADMTIAPSSVSSLDVTADGGSGDDSLRVYLHGGQDSASACSVLVVGGGDKDLASVSSNVSVFDVADVQADATA